MSWKDRAVAVDDQASPNGTDAGGWRSRAIPASGQDGSYWGDVGKNAMQGVKEIPQGAVGLADTATKAASVMSPMEMGKSIFQMGRGTPPSETNTGQDIQGTIEGAKGMAKGVWQGAKDVGNAAIMPAQIFSGKAPAQTSFGQSFRERPLSTTANLATAMAPLAKMGRAALGADAGGEVAAAGGRTAAEDLPVTQPGSKTGDPHALFAYNDDWGPGMSKRSLYNVYGDPEHPVVKARGWGSSVSAEDAQKAGIPVTGRQPNSSAYEPIRTPGAPAPATPGSASPAQPLNFLQRFGTKGVNSQAGITPETVQSMTKSGHNPSMVGESIGKRLVDENVVGQSPSETFSKVSAKMTQYGQSVKNALDQIKEANRSTGEWADVEDSLHVDSNKALKLLLDKKVALANSPFSANKQMARPWTEAYNYLADQANAAGGMTSLDHVNGTMQQVGQMLGKLEKGTAPYKNVAGLYGTLANMRDSMVGDIAQRLGNPSLRSNLLKANEGYSFYSRIMPDINWQAAAESVGGPETTIMGTIKSEARPFLSKTAVKAGSYWSRQHGT